MKLKLSAASLAAATAVLAATLPAGASASTATTARALPDVTALFPSAVRRVRANSRASRAIMLEAQGQTGGKIIKSASQITKWVFVLDNQLTPRTPFRSASISYGPGWGRVLLYRSPFLEDNRMPKAPTMTLARAITRLNSVGYRQGFGAVTLRDPVGPRRINPLYIFTLGPGSYVGVDTVTGRVAPLT